MTTTALLVIDLQCGAFDGIRCPPVDSPEQLIQNALTLIDAARVGDHPIVFVQHCEGADQPFEEGTEHGAFQEPLLPISGDSVLKKFRSSAFENTDLDALLKEKAITDLVLCGLQSEYCVSNTSRSALERGYSVHVARDAHGTWPEDGKTADEIKREVNRQLEAAGALLATTEELAVVLRERE